MGRRFRDSEHLIRVVVLFAAALVAFLVIRWIFLPEGFGVYGHFRAGALDDNRSSPLVHAGRAACLECHSDAGETLAGGKHSGVNCEACHGPLARHAEDPSEQEAVKPDPGAVCQRCHEQNVAKPVEFPQMDLEEHSSGEACTECHVPHSPGFE